MSLLTWVTREQTYVNHDDGLRGNVMLFTTFYDSTRPRGQGDDKPYSLVCRLPGIKDHLGHFATVEDAKAYSEKVFVRWLAKMGLEAKHDPSP